MNNARNRIEGFFRRLRNYGRISNGSGVTAAQNHQKSRMSSSVNSEPKSENRAPVSLARSTWKTLRPHQQEQVPAYCKSADRKPCT